MESPVTKPVDYMADVLISRLCLFAFTFLVLTTGRVWSQIEAIDQDSSMMKLVLLSNLAWVTFSFSYILNQEFPDDHLLNLNTQCLSPITQCDSSLLHNQANYKA